MNFDEIRKNIVGCGQTFDTPFGTFEMLYADWVASGRLYGPIEKAITYKFGPWVANTHSYSNKTGSLMTTAYNQAKEMIRNHVNASDSDMLVLTGSGMTGGVVRLQQILGLCTSTNGPELAEADRPIVFITHMEHHSHHVSWMETVADVVIVPPGNDLKFDLNLLQVEIDKYADRKLKIGAFTAGSNVTGVILPIHEMAEVMHKNGGYCFVDYAATAPYVDINMHPENKLQQLDAIYFSPHKFLGGPGACGVMLFDKKIYKGKSCVPGGGNVTWTNPWGDYGFTANDEAKEDGGTPGFLQAIRAALAIRLKEKMGTAHIEKREEELVKKAFQRMNAIEGVRIVGEQASKRIGVVSFNIDDIHYNAVVRIMNDQFGIQVRGGWACASTYCHYLFELNPSQSKRLTDGIDSQNLTGKPGWARLSLHPTMTDKQLDYVLDAIAYIAKNKQELKEDYAYDVKTNDFTLQKTVVDNNEVQARAMFEI
ncbi:aminotransferase class V-fold PLP-dependent enzyme [Reichenbachiella carrageenanivorans]|uniref:Aminotransferase class V-fold PLP-dependent enzyme n=1 Tax=Reichenbachiella carrageenanivorans TaxID=2979869 RepID=A0ABY6CZC7_9BACT|nr:aminotransferase class V-fold PLP-dependent enzyme [Reichenbachiella carrageenanivorans]UXX78769.1 aminotransferase class V-fold PLP-dependent enzyme [Reichenbachiella carrageenanivorans]